MVSERPSLFNGESPDVKEDAKKVIPNCEVWFSTPNLLLGFRTPAELIGTKEEPRVRDLIRALKHGFIS